LTLICLKISQKTQIVFLPVQMQHRCLPIGLFYCEK
jgi:hypothetical protein